MKARALEALPQQVERLQAYRRRPLLVLAASQLELELLPELYDQLRAIGPQRQLDVLLHSPGGVVNGARRIALLLREFAERLSIIVPFRCESSATMLALGADDIVAGPLAIFSPIDPHLHGGDGHSSFSSEDIRQFGAMCADWFGADADEARSQSLSLLCGSIFPPSLTAFYRSTLEMMAIGAELLRHQLPDADEAARRRIVQQLVSGYHTHSYALTRDELAALGLHIVRDTGAETLAWELSRSLQAVVGGAQRDSEEGPWFDALLATDKALRLRRRAPGGLAPVWQEA
jgi:hypothetical protein